MLQPANLKSSESWLTACFASTKTSFSEANKVAAWGDYLEKEIGLLGYGTLNVDTAQ